MTKKHTLLAALPLVALFLAATPAAADDHVGLQAGDVLVRARAVMVAPDEESTGITPAFPAERVAVTDSFAPEVDVTYMVTDAIGLELIAATTKHHVEGTSGTTGGIGRLAGTWVLPPTLTVQYHFNHAGTVRPYVGAGVNYTIFYNERASSGLQAAVGPTTVGLSDSVGWAAQAGVDIDVARNMFINVDVKYINIDTNAVLNTTAAGAQRLRVNLNPLVFGAGVGWRF